MDSITWAESFEKLLVAKGVERKPGPKEDGATVALIAEELGVPRRTAFRRLRTADKLKPHPNLKEKVRRGEMEAKKALWVVCRKEAEVKLEQSVAATSETTANGSRGRCLPLEALWRSPRDILNSYDFKVELGLRERHFLGGFYASYSRRI